jgi:hypothetical protein
VGRKRRRLLRPGTRKPPRVLPSALGHGKPSEDDLLRAYRSISFDMGPGHEGGRLYEGRSGITLSYLALTLTAATRPGMAK